MAVGGVGAAGVSVVQENKLAGESVTVGRHLVTEESKLRIAVAFRHVAEVQVVSVVLLDYVDHVLEDGGLANPLRNGDRLIRPPGRKLASPAVVLGDLPGQCSKVPDIVEFHELDRAHAGVDSISPPWPLRAGADSLSACYDQ